MTATLRTILEQPLEDARSDLAVASLHLTRALVRAAPAGCDVSALVPAGDESAAELIPELREVRVAPIQRRELLAAWQLGVGPSAGGGLVHSPTLAAPLVRHDRVNTGDQTVVTVWDLQAWEAPATMHRAAVAWTKAMMKRAVRHADAIVVPSFAHAEWLDSQWQLGDRLRVIPGAAAEDTRAVAERGRGVEDLPPTFVAVMGDAAGGAGWDLALKTARAAMGADYDVVFVDTPTQDVPSVHAAALQAGIPEERLQVREQAAVASRTALLGAASAFINTEPGTRWPWRVVEALTLGTPVISHDNAVVGEVLADAGVTAVESDLPAAAEAFMSGDVERAGVLAADRGRAFSWWGSAERIWQLHADL